LFVIESSSRARVLYQIPPPFPPLCSLPCASSQAYTTVGDTHIENETEREREKRGMYIYKREREREKERGVKMQPPLRYGFKQ